MHNGFPCTDMYPNEYFEDGITNGAKWYNVPGKQRKQKKITFAIKERLIVFAGDCQQGVKLYFFLDK